MSHAQPRRTKLESFVSIEEIKISIQDSWGKGNFQISYEMIYVRFDHKGENNQP